MTVVVTGSKKAEGAKKAPSTASDKPKKPNKKTGKNTDRS